jgi:hypothetical protein
MTTIKAVTTGARIFLTDYASYNNGTQFEFGHWVDLEQFSDVDELNDYISTHFEECDEKSPIDEYTTREEVMITDYEGFPEVFYSESGCEWEKIFKYIDLDYENLDDSEKVSLWNEYCQESKGGEDQIFEFDEEFFEMCFSGSNPMEVARAASFGSLNWSDDYIKFNGYGNLESFDSPIDEIDEDELLEWLIDNK